MLRILTGLLFLFFGAHAQNNAPPIGMWREHLPYGSAIDVTASAQKIYAATPFSIFRVDKTSGELDRLSKISGLSETGISTIKFDLSNNKLFIGYSNSNIDVLDAKGITNIPELKREPIAGDKSIYSIYPSGNDCYLSTGIGVVVLNTTRYEIKDTWIIGRTGGYVKVYGFTKDATYYYAATEEGLKMAAVAASDPADYRQWQTAALSEGYYACKAVVNLENRILALQNDSLFVRTSSGWQPFFANGRHITSVNASEGKVVLCQQNGSTAQVVVLDNTGRIETLIPKRNPVEVPKNGVLQNGQLWIADAYHALSQWNGNTLVRHFEPSSPEDIAAGEMLVHNNTFFAAAGTVNENWNYQYNAGGIFQYNNNEWKVYNRFTVAALDSVLDIITLSADPRDGSLWAGSFGSGLINIKGTTTTIFKQASPLGAAVGDPGSYRVSGLAFDANNNLWIANYGTPRYLHVRKKDGTWQSFTAPFSVMQNAVSQIIVDDWDQKWIVSPKGNGLIFFNHGASIENTGDDKWRLYRSGTGAGNLPSSDVLCIAKDKAGALWVGTADGVGIIECGADAWTGPCEAILPVTQNGGFGAYLFKGVEVRTIAVDGADRKWVGTPSGIWLISANGEKVLQHFTEDNSPLLSNDVKRITINGTTGEVFIATAKGICSFRASATEPQVKMDQLTVFPNPVPPGYGGTIAIKGLAANSHVKITELNGRLVFQTKALGGQAVWNGRDYTGRPISSGIYLVLVSTEDYADKAMGKIVFIAK